MNRLILLILVVGCARSEQLLDSGRDMGGADQGTRDDTDQGTRDGAADAAREPADSRVDATLDRDAVVDATPRDADGPETPGPLARALSCELSEREVIAASLRFAACVPDQEDHTNVSILFTLHTIGNMGLGRGWFDMPANCEFWQCVAGASSCAEFEACRAPHACVRDGDGRVVPSTTCEGNVAVRCEPEFTHFASVGDHGVSSRIDCGQFGQTCEEGNCQSPDCESPSSPFLNARCDGDRLLLCEGGPSVDCRTFNGTSCNQFYQEGELPATYCGPELFGLYRNIGACQGNEHVFFLRSDELGGGREIRIDCAEYGYAGCDERGCRDM